MSIESIEIPRLMLAFLPVAVVILLLGRWGLDFKHTIYAVARMLLQLMLIGYVLVFIFDADSALIIMAVLTIMMLAAGWIALTPLSGNKTPLFGASLLSILIGGGLTLVLVTQGVLTLEPWYRPSYMIPLAGMIFANSMTSISLAVERLGAELEAGRQHAAAEAIAFRTSLIPVINSLLAVGLVALPGMMTGQILSGVSPLIAARYQIMVMCMILGSAGISTAVFLVLTRRTAAYGSER